MIEIYINNQKIKAQKGERVIDIGDREGINIPRFCYHKKLSVAANCRMCLVKVEGAPKLMPACATYVNEGMKIFTQDAAVKKAQKSMMEFLLINHPLDCPVCDQGGECELQDVSLEFGNSDSNFVEIKRSVINPDIGPLISTELTRCIHCSRCVRFGQEIAGVMELGLAGRGMHTVIDTFLNRSVDSEISGNVIDLCPVGALTDKPSRFVARSWEMQTAAFVAMHDELGSNSLAHIHNNQIIRVVPDYNEAINEVWLSDIDRYSYQANFKQRYSEPMIKVDGKMQAVSWQKALEFAASGLQENIDSLGVLANPNQSAETLFLTKKICKNLAIQNFDSRLKLNDFSNKITFNAGFNLKTKPENLADLEALKTIVLLGTNLRYDNPLVNLRLRKAFQNGAKVYSLNCKANDYAYSVDDLNNENIIHCVSAPHLFLNSLKKIVEDQNFNSQPKQTLFILGNQAINAPNFEQLNEYLTNFVSKKESLMAYLSLGSNALATDYLNCYCELKSINTHSILKSKLDSYLLIDIDPKYDLIESALALDSFNQAKFVVSLNSHQNSLIEKYADVILPIATYYESGATHINLMHQIQSFNPLINTYGQAKPTWKVLSVLAQLIQKMKKITQPIEFYTRVEVEQAIRKWVKNKGLTQSSYQSNSQNIKFKKDEIIYLAIDCAVQTNVLSRYSDALPKTQWAKYGELIRTNQKTAQLLNLSQKQYNIFYQNQLWDKAELVIDDTVANNLVLIPAHKAPSTYLLHSSGKISLLEAKIQEQQNTQTGS